MPTKFVDKNTHQIRPHQAFAKVRVANSAQCEVQLFPREKPHGTRLTSFLQMQQTGLFVKPNADSGRGTSSLMGFLFCVKLPRVSSKFIRVAKKHQICKHEWSHCISASSHNSRRTLDLLLLLYHKKFCISHEFLCAYVPLCHI